MPRKKRERYRTLALGIAKQQGIKLDPHDWPAIWQLLEAHPEAARSRYVKEPAQRKQRAPDSFYTSEAWFKARYVALRNSDGKCELCGRSKHDGIILHVDHIKPRSRFPRLQLDTNNLQVLCNQCNKGKRNTDCIMWKR